MRALFTVTICLLLVAISAPDARARDASRTLIDRIVSRGELRVGTTGDYPPFSNRNERGQFVGIDIEMARGLARSLGVKARFVETSWNTLVRDLAADRFDIGMGGISITLERQRGALFSLPYRRGGKAPITRCVDKGRFGTLAQIDQPGVTVLVNPGGTSESFIRSRIQRATVVRYDDNLTIFDRLLDGKGDVMITDAVETLIQQKMRPGLCAVRPDRPFTYEEFGYLLPRDLYWKAYVDPLMGRSSCKS